MPIKFRCQHCRQFLGISRSKAGDVVDCPTCGRSLRVPNLDGSVEPLPELKINVAELGSALNELAKIGDEAADDDGAADPAASFSAPVQVKELAPLPTPEPIALDEAEPAEKVDLQADRTKQAVAELAASSDNAKQVQAEFAKVHQRLSPTSFPRVLRVRSVMATLAGTAALMFVVGWSVGGLGKSSAPGESKSSNGKPKTGDTGKPPRKQSSPLPADWKPGLKGKVQFLSGGKGKPDAGAIILVLPDDNRTFSSKLPAEGFRTGVSAESLDFRVSASALNALNGNAAIADNEGNYEIKLPPTAQNFVAIVISNNSTNDVESEIEAGVRNVLHRFFASPLSLIKRQRYKFSRRNFDGKQVESFNHEFD